MVSYQKHFKRYSDPAASYFSSTALLSLRKYGAWLLCLSIMLFSMMSAAKAQCFEVKSSDQLPQQIAADKCYELQGGNELSKQTIVLGKLFLKAGRNAVLLSNSNIVLAGDGVFEVRGAFEMRHNSQVSLNEKSSLTNSGEIIMQNNTAIGASGAPNIRNLGRLIAENGSQIRLTGETTFKNSGELSMTGAKFMVDDKAVYTNAGTNYADLGSEFTFRNHSKFFNQGRTLLSKNSQMNFQGNSKAESRRQFPVAGRLFFSDDALYENYALFKLQTDGTLRFSDASQLLNNHTIEIRGKAYFQTKARVLNDGTFAVKQGGDTQTMQNAVFINNGTFRNEGGGFTIDNQSNFINQSIISGHQSRSQGHDRLERKNEEDLRKNEASDLEKHNIKDKSTLSKEKAGEKAKAQAAASLNTIEGVTSGDDGNLPNDLSPDAMAPDLSHLQNAGDVSENHDAKSSINGAPDSEEIQPGSAASANAGSPNILEDNGPAPLPDSSEYDFNN